MNIHGFKYLSPKQAEKWTLVSFNCSNGWDKVTTSIPENEKENAKEYLEKQGTGQGELFRDVTNIEFIK